MSSAFLILLKYILPSQRFWKILHFRDRVLHRTRRNKMALVQRVAPILFRLYQSPKGGLATSNYASYPTPPVDTSTTYSWNCYPVMGRFNGAKQILSGLISAPHHRHILLGRVVSVPRARFLPPCSRRTGVDM